MRRAGFGVAVGWMNMEQILSQTSDIRVFYLLQCFTGRFLDRQFHATDPQKTFRELNMKVHYTSFKCCNFPALPKDHAGQNHDRNQKRYSQDVFHGFSLFLHSAFNIAREEMLVKR